MGSTGPVATSAGQVIVASGDTTGPTAPPSVWDGLGTSETSTTGSTTQLSATWTRSSENTGSGVMGYQYAIGTTSGGTDVVNWGPSSGPLTYTGPVQSITLTGLSLTLGKTYYISIRGVNGDWYSGPSTCSSGQKIVTDTTPPTAPVVRDGTSPTEIPVTYSSSVLSANWTASTAPGGSGISGYQYAIGTSAGATNVVGWTSVGNVLGVTKTGLSLSWGTTYYFTVKATSGAGVVGSAANSSGITPQNGPGDTPTAPPAVYDGTTTGVETPYTTSTTQLSANWSAASDPQSGITGYQYAIGTTAGGTNVVAWTGLGNVLTVTKTGLSLTNGQKYYFSVKAVNGVGTVGPATNSPGCTVDTTPPTAPPAVYDGTTTGVETPYTTSTTQLSANWSASTDSISGISGYQYAIGTTAGGTNVVGWTSVGNVLSVTKTGLSLTNGQKYYFSVKATDNAGLVGSATNSPGQTVDTTPPTAPPVVYDGTTTGVETSTTTSTTQLSANWSASTDSISGISGYQYAIGTTAGGTNVVGWTSVGNVLTVTKTGLGLNVGTTYYFSVKATDNAGLVGSATNSSGCTVVSSGSTIYFQDNFEGWAVYGGAWSTVNGISSNHTLDTSANYAEAGDKSLQLYGVELVGTIRRLLDRELQPRDFQRYQRPLLRVSPHRIWDREFEL